MSKLTNRIRTMECEADALERGADVLARSGFGNAGPALEGLGRALELVLRKEAERTRYKARNGKTLAELYPDEAPA